jgi:hypothetical protein
MNTTLPDRLSIDPKSSYYNEALIVRGVRIRFNGVKELMSRSMSAKDGFASPPATAETGMKTADNETQGQC